MSPVPSPLTFIRQKGKVRRDALLRYNLHTLKFIHLNCLVLWVLEYLKEILFTEWYHRLISGH